MLKHIQSLPRDVFRWVARPVYVFLLVFSISVTARAEAGLVAFALGESSVTRGQSIHVGDVIKTGDNGHVHIRFIDGALVSLRPNSELKVNEYRYDPDQPENNRVRFTLGSGTVRSVTGEAGRVNKESYRMNTPISAIGIRGTDYTVYSDERKTRVFVQSGGVAIAPLDEQCPAEEVGVCRSSRLVELFAGDSHVIELSLLKHDQVNRQSRETLSAPSVQLSPDFELTTLKLNKSIDVARKTDFGEDQVGWSNWSNYQQVLGDLFKPTLPFLMADWRIVSANSGFGLFLDPRSGGVPRDGLVQYELDRYEAYLVTGGGIEQASMQDAGLGIDFGSKRFRMQSVLSGGQMSSQLDVDGVLTSDGLLRAVSDQFEADGGITADGADVGLLFEQRIDANSRFVGASAWSRQ